MGLNIISNFNFELILTSKVGCVFPLIIIPILPQAEFGPNDHQEDAPHFINISCICSFENGHHVQKLTLDSASNLFLSSLQMTFL